MAKNSDPAILFVRPDAINDADLLMLQSAGVLVVRVADPAEIKFTRASVEISGSELLSEVLRIVNTYSGDTTKAKVVDALARLTAFPR